MTIPDFNNEYLTPMHAKILQEEKTCLLMPGFISILDTDPKVLYFYDILSSNFFAPYILQPKKLVKNSKTLIDIFSNSIEYLFSQFNFENIRPSYKNSF